MAPRFATLTIGSDLSMAPGTHRRRDSEFERGESWIRFFDAHYT